MTAAELEAQARSFAFGNGNIENPKLTMQAVDEAAKRMSRVADSA